MPTNTLLSASPSPGAVEHLVLARDRADLCPVLRQIFAGRKFSVVVDRRNVERRQRYEPVRMERRRGSRRGGPTNVSRAKIRPHELVRGYR